MNAATLADVVDRLRALAGPAAASDRHLLARFAADRDEAAFACLVERHGPLVLGVCRRLLRDPAAADDAFQAVFLVLCRQAGARTWGPSVAGWLHAVAHRVAAKARVADARRLRRETAAVRVHGSEADAAPTAELVAAVEEEVGRLPDKYRLPVVLCHLEGLTHAEAAARLRWPVGTVAGRLARARDLLRQRLTRRGLAPAGLTVAVPVAVVSRGVAAATVRGAVAFAAGAGPSTAAVSLAQGVLSAMKSFPAWIPFALVTLVGLGALAALTPGTTSPTAPAVLADEPAGSGKPAPPPARIDRPVRILLFAGGPTRDYQFVRRLLVNEVDCRRAELAICLPPAKDGKLGVQDVPSERLLPAFPDVLEPDRKKADAAGRPFANLAEYDVIVAFDAEWTAVPTAALELLKKWVAQGGGLVLVGGPLHTPAWADPTAKEQLQPLLDLAPVTIARDQRWRDLKQPFRLRFTGDGERAGFLALADDGDGAPAGWGHFFDDPRPAGAPRPVAPDRGFYGVCEVESVKARATVLARCDPPGPDGKAADLPFVVASRVEKGRVLFVAAGETWRVRQYQEAAFDRLWRRLVRHAAGVPDGKAAQE